MTVLQQLEYDGHDLERTAVHPIANDSPVLKSLPIFSDEPIGHRYSMCSAV